MLEQVFHCFPQLPLELREAIWRCCLPYRTREVDFPLAEAFFMEAEADDPSHYPIPCDLYETARANGRPPLITRVCYEARKVAQETGSLPPVTLSDTYVRAFVWRTGCMNHHAWRDPARDTVHLHHQDCVDIVMGISSTGSPVEHLARNICHTEVAQDHHRSTGGGSLMAVYLDSSFDFVEGHSYEESVTLASGEVELPLSPDVLRDRDVLKRFPSWLVVMRIIIVHQNVEAAAATGMFGLLCDSWVQIIDVAEDEKITIYYDLAASCEAKQEVTVGQDFRRESASSWAKRLGNLVSSTYRDNALVQTMRPAIMFRLCRRACNHLPERSKRSMPTILCGGKAVQVNRPARKWTAELMQ
ncbi:hypothetical protein LTR97_007266 [Elasticomyces elasticus]|uniref:2EXR domain-containing protein n=1 Tax=Elasticomyces elasticus TaxID=574655 RepID=A0AAN7WAD1_9PEZI|nr:hypothetical protein LTR97_007266 [Elasticomyces elasticus]